MFDVSVLGELLPDFFAIPINEWIWPNVILIVLASVGCMLGRSLRGTSKYIAQTAIVLIVVPIIAMISVLNFILRCIGKDTMSFEFLKDILPWSNEKSMEAEKAPGEQTKKQRLTARLIALKKTDDQARK